MRETFEGRTCGIRARERRKTRGRGAEARSAGAGPVIPKGIWKKGSGRKPIVVPGASIGTLARKDVEVDRRGERLCQGPPCKTGAVRNELRAVMGQRACYPRVEAAAHEGDASAYYIEGVAAALTGREHR